MYLEALKLVTRSAELVEKRDYIGAIRLTQQAEEKGGTPGEGLSAMAAQPSSNTPPAQQGLDQWQKLAQQQAAAVSSDPAWNWAPS